MICRVWCGWTTRADGGAYDAYLKHELFPRVERELSGRGYKGYQLLRRDRGGEFEFITMLWFDSLEAVKGFAGANYETAIVSDKARALLSRYAESAEHYEFRGSSYAPAASTVA